MRCGRVALVAGGLVASIATSPSAQPISSSTSSSMNSTGTVTTLPGPGNPVAINSGARGTTGSGIGMTNPSSPGPSGALPSTTIMPGPAMTGTNATSSTASTVTGRSATATAG